MARVIVKIGLCWAYSFCWQEPNTFYCLSHKSKLPRNMKCRTSQSELFKSVYIARNLKIQHKSLRPGFPGGSVVKNRLTVPETRVRVLIQENFTCCEQLRLCSEPRSHNYWSPHALEPMLLNNKGNCNWEAQTWNESVHPSPQLEKSPCSKRLNKTKNKPKKQNPRLPSFHQINSQSPFQVL